MAERELVSHVKLMASQGMGVADVVIEASQTVGKLVKTDDEIRAR